jgi:hypothetical protein
MQVSTIGVDLAKNVFQVHGVDSDGKVVITRRPAARRSPRLSCCSRQSIAGTEGSDTEQKSIGPARSPLAGVKADAGAASCDFAGRNFGCARDD